MKLTDTRPRTLKTPGKHVNWQGRDLEVTQAVRDTANTLTNLTRLWLAREATGWRAITREHFAVS